MPTFFPGDLVHSRQYGSGRVTSIESEEMDAFGKRLPVAVEFGNGAVRNFTERGQLQHGAFDWQFMISPLAPEREGPPSQDEVDGARAERLALAVASLRGFLQAKPNDVIALAEDSDGRTHCLRYRDLEVVVAAAGKRPEASWQPIETAPKDGTRVVLWAEGTWTAGLFEGGEWCSLPDGYPVIEAPTHWAIPCAPIGAQKPAQNPVDE